MADTGAKKGKQKKKGKTISLNDFLTTEGGSSTPIGSSYVLAPRKQVDWAEETEDVNVSEDPSWHDDYYRPSRPAAVDRSKLPTAPKASLASTIEYDRLPKCPPYTAFIGNLPYDVEQSDVMEFFRGNKVKEVRIPRENDSGRIKGFGYVEFEDLNSMISALGLNDETLKNRKVRVDVADSAGQGSKDSDNTRSASDDSDDWRARKEPADPPPHDGDRYGDRGGYERGYNRGGYDRDGRGDRDSRWGSDRDGRGSYDRDYRGGYDRERRGGYGDSRGDYDGGGSGYDRDGRSGYDRDGRGGHDREGRGGADRDYRSGYGRDQRSGYDRDYRGSYDRDNRGGQDRDYRGGYDRENRGGYDRENRGGYDRDYRGSYDRDNRGGSDRDRWGRGRDGYDRDSDRRKGFGQGWSEGGRDRDGGGGRASEYDRGNPPEPTERPKLQLKKRTVPVDKLEVDAAASKPSIFGNAKPVDTTAKEQEIEKRLEKERAREEEMTRQEREEREGDRVKHTRRVSDSERTSRARSDSGSSGGAGPRDRKDSGGPRDRKERERKSSSSDSVGGRERSNSATLSEANSETGTLHSPRTFSEAPAENPWSKRAKATAEKQQGKTDRTISNGVKGEEEKAPTSPTQSPKPDSDSGSSWGARRGAPSPKGRGQGGDHARVQEEIERKKEKTEKPIKTYQEPKQPVFSQQSKFSLLAEDDDDDDGFDETEDPQETES